MTDRVLGPGATGAGDNGDQTDPEESTVKDAVTPDEAPKPILPPAAPDVAPVDEEDDDK